jgi:hypothetical protein
MSFIESENEKKNQDHNEYNSFFLFFFFSVLRLELKAYTLSHSTSPIFLRRDFFQHRVSQAIFLGWLQTAILLISAS